MKTYELMNELSYTSPFKQKKIEELRKKLPQNILRVYVDGNSIEIRNELEKKQLFTDATGTITFSGQR
jgi:hypothetical protein